MVYIPFPIWQLNYGILFQTVIVFDDVYTIVLTTYSTL